MSKYTASEANGEKRIAFLNRRIIYLNILCAEQVRKLLAASFCESLVKIAWIPFSLSFAYFLFDLLVFSLCLYERMCVYT